MCKQKGTARHQLATRCSLLYFYDPLEGNEKLHIVIQRELDRCRAQVNLICLVTLECNELLKQLFLRQTVQVTIERTVTVLTGLDLAADAVEAGHQECREQQVRIGGWIGGAKLDALGLWIVGQWNTYRRATIALREDQVDRSFETGHQAFVAIGRWGRDRHQCWRVAQNAADIVAC